MKMIESFLHTTEAYGRIYINLDDLINHLKEVSSLYDDIFPVKIVLQQLASELSEAVKEKP